VDAADDVSEGQIAVGNGETDDATGAGAQMTPKFSERLI